MIGGGPFGFDPYEWTDDTSMSIALAEALASNSHSTTDTIQDAVLSQVLNRWHKWSLESKDVGAQTRSILSASARTARASNRPEISVTDALSAAKAHHETHGRSGGNGSLMRTAPLALAFLRAHGKGSDDEEAKTETALMCAAAKVSALTHWDRDAQEACGIWCIAIRHAVLTGEMDVRRALKRPSLFEAVAGLETVKDSSPAPVIKDQSQAEAVKARVRLWESRIAVAEERLPNGFERNGWVVEAFQAAWSSIYNAHVSKPPNPLRLTLETAIRGGNDTDTVAAIAGGLVGAVYGAGEDVIPDKWRKELHGWPGLNVNGLEALVSQIVGGG